jgi:translation elongation factor EF-Ts
LSENQNFVQNKRIAGFSSHKTNGIIVSRIIGQQEQQQTITAEEGVCVSCKIRHNCNETVVYKMNCCSHLICRKEWLKKLTDNHMTNTCNTCNQKIESVVKVQQLNAFSL